jgi:hypothetical protein
MEKALLGELGRASPPARTALPLVGSVRALQTLAWPSPTEPVQLVVSDTTKSHKRVLT